MGLTTDDLSVQVYDRLIMTGPALKVSLVKFNTISFDNPFNSLALTPDATKFITLTIKRVRNPNSMKESGSFIIQTFDGPTRNQIS